jgi:PAS domain S-box-containing protein
MHKSVILDWISRRRLILASWSWVAYFLAALLGNYLFKWDMSGLVLAPLLGSAWLLGRWAGLVLGLASYLVAVFVSNAAGDRRLAELSGATWYAPLWGLGLIGWLAGWLAELRSRTQQPESDLQQKFDELERFFSVAPALMMVAGSDGHIQWLNPQWETTLGYALRDLLGQPFLGFVHPDDIESTRQAVVVLEAGRHVLGFTNRYRRRDGSYHWLEWNAVERNSLIYAVAHDITERKQAEEKLESSEARYRQAITAAGAVPYYRDFQNETDTYTFIGEDIFKLTGFPAAEITPAIFDKLVLEEYMRGSLAQYTSEEVSELSKAGKIQNWSIDSRIQTRDGQIRWVTDSGVPVRDENNRRVGAIGILQDITERKQADEALRAGAAQYRELFKAADRQAHELALLDQVHTAVAAELELGQLYRTVVEALVNTLGYKMVSLYILDADMLRLQRQIGYEQTIFEIPLTAGVLGRVVRTGQAVLLENAAADPDFLAAQPGLRSEVCVPIRDQGRAVGALNVETRAEETLDDSDLRLVTAVCAQLSAALTQARLYTSLRESEARNRAIADAVPDLLFQLTPDGVYLDYRARDISNLFVPPEAFLGKNMRDVLPAEVAAGAQSAITEALSAGRLTIFEYMLPLAGEPRHFENRTVPLGNGNVLSVIRDVTEQRRAEAEVRQMNQMLERRVAERTVELERANTELVQASRAKDEFLAAMSHELRTPLNAILTMTESLAEGTYGPVGGKQLKPLDIIARSGQHLLSLINDILNLAKIEAGKLVLNRAPMDVGPVCQASLQLVEQQARQKNITLMFKPDPAVTLIQADERYFTQILVNLLDNAVKFTPDGGQAGLTVAGDAAAGRVRLTVWDTGIGMTAENIGRLFQPFMQIDSGLARRYSGTGLGLVLVQRLTRLHGGDVAVASAPGLGSRFTVSLPWLDGSLPTAAETAAPKSQASISSGTPAPGGLAAAGPVIMLAEDDAYTRTAVSEFLAGKGYTLVVAEDGEAALQRTREARPDLIIMDIQMPGMDGLEVIRRLRAEPAFRSVSIIALTALAMPGDRERCLTAGADDYLTKPIRLRQLAETVTLWLSRSSGQNISDRAASA